MPGGRSATAGAPESQPPAAHDLQPHRICTFERSSDPELAAKLADTVGVDVDPPTHAIHLPPVAAE